MRNVSRSSTSALLSRNRHRNGSSSSSFNGFDLISWDRGRPIARGRYSAGSRSKQCRIIWSSSSDELESEEKMSAIFFSKTKYYTISTQGNLIFIAQQGSNLAQTNHKQLRIHQYIHFFHNIEYPRITIASSIFRPSYNLIRMSYGMFPTVHGCLPSFNRHFTQFQRPPQPPQVS
jgi:hypothetical protein